MMRKGSSIINTARGKIIKSLDIIEKYLRQGYLHSVAFDVLPQEPPDFSHSLIHAWKTNDEVLRGRILINPHTAYYSDEAIFEMRSKASETLKLFLTEGILRNRIRS